MPSLALTDVTPRKSPGRISESAIGSANTIWVLSSTWIRPPPCTESVTPSKATMVPRTRVCACTAVHNIRRTRLVRRANAIFAHVEALDDDLVAFLARVGPDGLARLQIRARARIEGDDRRARRHQHFLRAALVV